jgi:hypothetical protein
MDLCHPATVAEGQRSARDKIARYLGVGRATIKRAGAIGRDGGGRTMWAWSGFRDVSETSVE